MATATHQRPNPGDGGNRAYNPPYPALGSNIPSARRPGQRFHFLLCRGSSLRKQAWRNPKEGRVGCLHQNIFTRKVTDIAFTSYFCNNHSHPAFPTSLYLTSPRPRPTRPHVPYLMSSSPSSRVPNSQVPTHASRFPCPTFLHSRCHKNLFSRKFSIGSYFTKMKAQMIIQKKKFSVGFSQ